MIRQGLILCLFCTVMVACEKGEFLWPQFYSCAFTRIDSSATHPENAKYQDLLRAMTNEGVPGVLMSVNDPANGEWSGAAGMADLFNRYQMRSCNISRLGSTVKTFTAPRSCCFRRKASWIWTTGSPTT
jgi:D-alanyl-D-alanine carboxypeptidase